MLSIPHMIVVFIVVLVVFGPQKLPELARGLGKLMAEFRKASADFKGAFENEMREIERQAVLKERQRAAEAAAAAAAAAPVQPASQGTPAGAATDAVGGAGSSAMTDTRTTEALVATPVAEAVARGTEFPVTDHAHEPAKDATSTNGTGGHGETVGSNAEVAGSQETSPAAFPHEAREADPVSDTLPRS
jgi:sec-independent protein translocase protein TatB